MVMEQLEQLENLFDAAKRFVEEHYKTSDEKDKNIKILATINQLIELKKLPPDDFISLVRELVSFKKQSEQKGQ